MAVAETDLRDRHEGTDAGSPKGRVIDIETHSEVLSEPYDPLALIENAVYEAATTPEEKTSAESFLTHAALFREGWNVHLRKRVLDALEQGATFPSTIATINMTFEQ